MARPQEYRWRKLSAGPVVPLVNGMRTAGLQGSAPQCTRNIFEQQFQMGLFVRKNYQGSNVALNDIGIVDYLADIHLLDLWGLASQEVAQARRSRRYQEAQIASFSRQAHIKIQPSFTMAWFRATQCCRNGFGSEHGPSPTTWWRAMIR